MDSLNEQIVPMIEKHLGIELQNPETITPEKLEQMLTEQIVFMLRYEMEKLLQALYRIDVNEQKVKAVFAQNDAKKIAPELARLIIERELQKAESRKNYK
jgi:hypothetical protein